MGPILTGVVLSLGQVMIFFNSFTEHNLIGNNEIVVPSSSIKKHYTFLMYTFEGVCEGDGDGS